MGLLRRPFRADIENNVTIGTHAPAGLWAWRGLRLGYVVLAVVATGAGATTYALASTVLADRAGATGSASAVDGLEGPPIAAEFAWQFVGVANAYARAHGDRVRLVHPDCVQASPGHYMCSYVVRRPGRTDECRIMQAVWTPDSLSSFKVMLSGQVDRCGSLREALLSLH